MFQTGMKAAIQLQDIDMSLFPEKTEETKLTTQERQDRVDELKQKIEDIQEAKAVARSEDRKGSIQ